MSKLILRQIYGTGVDVNLVFNKICKCQRFDSFQTAARLNKKNALIRSNALLIIKHDILAIIT